MKSEFFAFFGCEAERGKGVVFADFDFCACSPFTSEIYAKRERERKAGKKAK